VATKGSNIELATEDRFYPGLSGGEIEFDHPIHSAVVGDRQAIHPQLFCPGDELWDAAQAIEKAIFGMNMKMSEH